MQICDLGVTLGQVCDFSVHACDLDVSLTLRCTCVATSALFEDNDLGMLMVQVHGRPLPGQLRMTLMTLD